MAKTFRTYHLENGTEQWTTQAQALNRNTDKADGFIWAYEHSTDHSVLEAYGRPSTAKLQAERDIFADMLMFNPQYHKAYGYRVMGANCFHFSAGYIVEDIFDDTNDTGRALIVETHANTYIIPLNADDITDGRPMGTRYSA